VRAAMQIASAAEFYSCSRLLLRCLEYIRLRIIEECFRHKWDRKLPFDIQPSDLEGILNEFNLSQELSSRIVTIATRLRLAKYEESVQ
jgi:hypothetical protein